MKQIEKLKLQLTELVEAVNSFQSEAVQLVVVDRMLRYLDRLNSRESERESDMVPANTAEVAETEEQNDPAHSNGELPIK